jgi:hypothetical protein
MRDAYAAAFSKNSSGVQAALSSKSVDALSVVRNLMCTKGHSFDREYMRRAADLSLPPGMLGMKLLLDGEITVNLIKPALDSGAKLITAVDTWLTQNR